MTRYFLLMVLMILLPATTALSQQKKAVWVQVEAQPSLARAQESIRRYATALQDVNGFSLGSGWYAIALGPYTTEDAEQVLRVYRSEGIIPRDSYIAFSSSYRQQFWPIGANFLNRTPLNTPDIQTAETPEPEPETLAAEPLTEPADETPSQARQGERLLSREDRADLQIALKWAGFYDGAIDAAFGRGTRSSMARWQEANNFEGTGILTTKQRAELMRQYNAVLEGLGLQMVSDAAAGISIKMPLDIVAFQKYDPPFAHYTATGDVDASLLLISQEGDSDTLTGLYDIMQTLEIVPETGPRTLKQNAFTLIGESALTISHTEVWLQNGQIKGFSLVWPAGDEERRTRLLGEMQQSFARIDGVLDANAGNHEEQSIDLVSGLEIRRPIFSRSGFFVDQAGTVVTTVEVVESCRRITIEDGHEAEVAASNNGLGIAVLRPLENLAPLTIAAFQQVIPRLKSDIAVAGYSYGGVLGAPTLTFGQLSDVRGLNGEKSLKRLALAALDGDVGGPVIDAGGAVLGMLLPASQSGRKLPEGVSFAADADAVQQVLTQAGISISKTSEQKQIPPEVLTHKAAGMTVLVRCWE